jgi:hypothetical protein
VRLFGEVGDDSVIATARELGVTSPIEDGDPSVALGTSTMTLMELTAAYAGSPPTSSRSCRPRSPPRSRLAREPVRRQGQPQRQRARRDRAAAARRGQPRHRARGDAQRAQLRQDRHHPGPPRRAVRRLRRRAGGRGVGRQRRQHPMPGSPAARCRRGSGRTS